MRPIGAWSCVRIPFWRMSIYFVVTVSGSSLVFSIDMCFCMASKCSWQNDIPKKHVLSFTLAIQYRGEQSFAHAVHGPASFSRRIWGLPVAPFTSHENASVTAITAHTAAVLSVGSGRVHTYAVKLDLVWNCIPTNMGIYSEWLERLLGVFRHFYGHLRRRECGGS